MRFEKENKIWGNIIHEAGIAAKKEPILYNFYYENILKHKTLSSSLSYILSSRLSNKIVSEVDMSNIFNKIYLSKKHILYNVIEDIEAVLKKDPSVNSYLIPFLYLKGFHALESYRLSNYLWKEKNYFLSIYLQNRISTVFSVDIHPAARIGSGVMFDHATGIVIGEGVIIEDQVSILHSVTLGSTGKNCSKYRHPIIRSKVSIGAGAKILGNIEIGSQSKIGAGAVVVNNVPPRVTVVGIPAKIVNQSEKEKKSFCQKNKKNFSLRSEYFKYGDRI